MLVRVPSKSGGSDFEQLEEITINEAMFREDHHFIVA
jgi:hypothetical protein